MAVILSTPRQQETVETWYPTFRGRASRSQWWLLASSAFLLLFLIQHPFLAPLGGQPAGTPTQPESTPTWAALTTLAIYLTNCVLLTTVSVRRLHDRGKSGWWVLLYFVPVIGQLWLFLELGVLPGTRGPNRYG